MIKILAYILLTILVVDLIVSLVLGHVSNFYDPQIKASYSATIASLLGIIALVLFNASL